MTGFTQGGVWEICYRGQVDSRSLVRAALQRVLHLIYILGLSTKMVEGTGVSSKEISVQYIF